ncbi:MAG: response regulator [Bryobacteraceae bacterium]|nr:response regulator [Bryobacteraceae bacterium]
MSVVSRSNSSSSRILLVDDNKLGLSARKAVLEELGYAVVTAGSGQEALSRFAEHHFQLVVTDYKMPRMNGVDLIAELRKGSPDIPIILLSGFADTLGLDETNTGANAVIQKSANEVVLMVRTVRRLLRETPRKKPAASQQTEPRAKRKSS